MNIVAIIQARYGSTRFPGKVLERIGEHTVLQHVCARVQQAIPRVVVATPNTPKDARVYEHAISACKVRAFIWDGPENDVLGRYVACAREHDADVIVRITADCPLVDPGLIMGLVELHLRTGAAYVGSTELENNVNGLDVEVFSRELLNAAAQFTNSREHVTDGMRSFPDAIRVHRTLPLPGIGQHRWVVDTPEDLAWFKCLSLDMPIEGAPGPSIPQLVAFFGRHPEMSHFEPPRELRVPVHA